MSVIIWRKHYETGINILDEEHKQLLNLINLVYSAIRDKKGPSVIAAVLTDLERYTVDHFQHEEKLLEKYGYPDFQAHLQKHKAFINELKDKKAKMDSDQDELAKELLRFMREWLVNHIMVMDKNYGPFLEARVGRFVD